MHSSKIGLLDLRGPQARVCRSLLSAVIVMIQTCYARENIFLFSPKFLRKRPIVEDDCHCTASEFQFLGNWDFCFSYHEGMQDGSLGSTLDQTNNGE